jgi:hypothetical protein
MMLAHISNVPYAEVSQLIQVPRGNGVAGRDTVRLGEIFQIG